MFLSLDKRMVSLCVYACVCECFKQQVVCMYACVYVCMRVCERERDCVRGETIPDIKSKTILS